MADKKVEREAKEKAVAQRKAARKAEAERVEAERIAAERAAAEAAAAEAEAQALAEAERIAAEEAAAKAELERQRVEAEEAAAAEAEQRRLEEEEAAAAKAAEQAEIEKIPEWVRRLSKRQAIEGLDVQALLRQGAPPGVILFNGGDERVFSPPKFVAAATSSSAVFSPPAVRVQLSSWAVERAQPILSRCIASRVLVLREGAALDSRVIGKLPAGSEAFVLETRETAPGTTRTLISCAASTASPLGWCTSRKNGVSFLVYSDGNSVGNGGAGSNGGGTGVGSGGGSEVSTALQVTETGIVRRGQQAMRRPVTGGVSVIATPTQSFFTSTPLYTQATVAGRPLQMPLQMLQSTASAASERDPLSAGYSVLPRTRKSFAVKARSWWQGLLDREEAWREAAVEEAALRATAREGETDDGADGALDISGREAEGTVVQGGSVAAYDS